MYKELITDFNRLLAPTNVNLPSFVRNRDVPYNLISVMVSVFTLSTEEDKYTRIVLSDDKTRAYVIYDGLYDAIGTIMVDDVILLDGSPCLVVVMDRETFLEKDEEYTIGMLFSATLLSLAHIRMANHNMFYKHNKTMDCIYNESQVVIFIVAVLTAYDHFTDKSMDMVVSHVKMIHGFEDADAKLINDYVDAINRFGADMMLDNSIIAVNIVGRYEKR